MSKHRPWNRCDDCGRFIAYEDFEPAGTAVRDFATPDTAFSSEEFLTLCKVHGQAERERQRKRGERCGP